MVLCFYDMMVRKMWLEELSCTALVLLKLRVIILMLCMNVEFHIGSTYPLKIVCELSCTISSIKCDILLFLLHS